MSHVDEGTLHGYLDGELSPAEAQGVEAHLAQCPGCRGRLEEERALIARAGELLALAAPPDRELPPFRAGDVKPPARLWWKVRLPLAWAATVVLALGIGRYFGSGAPSYLERFAPAPTPTPAPIPPTASVAPHDVRSRDLAAPEATTSLTGKQPRTEARVATQAAAPSPPARTVPTRVAAEADRPGARDEMAVGFTIDSARAVLGHDPVALPGTPVRAVRRERIAGYAAGVVIEQQLDSSTVVELVERRAAQASVNALVVPAAEGGAMKDSGAREKGGRAGAEARARRPLRRLGNLEIQISGPLPSDSLQKLLQLVQPVPP